MSLRVPDSGIRSSDAQETYIECAWARREFGGLTVEDLSQRVLDWTGAGYVQVVYRQYGIPNYGWCAVCDGRVTAFGRTPEQAWLDYIQKAPL